MQPAQCVSLVVGWTEEEKLKYTFSLKSVFNGVFHVPQSSSSFHAPWCVC